MYTFKQYLNEVFENSITETSKEESVTSDRKYDSGQSFKKKAKLIDKVGGLHLYRAGNTHFTWHPEDRKIHHVVHAVESTTTPEGKTRYKWLSAHARKGSPVKMGDVYKHLVHNHNTEFVATGHSPGAKKMWNKFRADSSLKVTHEDGREVGKDENVYAPKNTKDPELKAIGKKPIILTKREK